MIKDGLSNTVIFSECLRGNNEIITNGLWQWYATPDTGTVATPLATLAANCIKAAATTPVPASGGTKCGQWLDHNTGLGGGYTHIMTPNTAGLPAQPGPRASTTPASAPARCIPAA